MKFDTIVNSQNISPLKMSYSMNFLVEENLGEFGESLVVHGCIHSLDWTTGLESFWIQHITGVMQIISLVYIDHTITYERVLAYLC